ncbi:MAG: hypothetical protein IPM59_00880 [Chloracidobacterium sp.]|nr:hypothetical protein [Chloracidobacterium sp.]
MGSTPHSFSQNLEGGMSEMRLPPSLGGASMSIRRLVGLGAIVAPTLHSITDLMEWLQGGFSPVQLWLNYFAFLLVPAVLVGLYAVQRPRIGRMGLVGSLLYGFSFIYFAHSTLHALEAGVQTYEGLWAELGWLYSLHGAAMILGGVLFGSAALKASVFPRWTVWLFLLGLGLNLLFAVIPLAEIFQTLGTTVRNIGLVGMGFATGGGAKLVHKDATQQQHAADGASRRS